MSTQELSLQITMKSSCHFLLNYLGMLTLQDSTQFSNSISSLLYSRSLGSWLCTKLLNFQSHNMAGWCLEFNWLQTTFVVLYNPLAPTTYKTHQLPSNRYPLLFPGISTDILPSNGHPSVVMRLSGKVFTGLLPSNESIHHNMQDMLYISINLNYNKI
jgi:hypothetical protein